MSYMRQTRRKPYATPATRALDANVFLAALRGREVEWNDSRETVGPNLDAASIAAPEAV